MRSSTSSTIRAPVLVPPDPGQSPGEGLALVLGGGGARGAYQAGVLSGLARRFPELRFPILTGISAGAVNTVHLASDAGSMLTAAGDLVRLWLALTPDRVFDVDALPVLRNVAAWGARLVSGGRGRAREPLRGMVDTSPLRRFLKGALPCATDGSLPNIAANIERGTLRTVALSAMSYTTGDSVTWVQGRDVELWQRPHRRSEEARLTVDHVMASSALPMLFPAVRIGAEWFGDGGVRLTAPLSPALHAGASRILTISTRYGRGTGDAGRSLLDAYPPPAQIMGVLYNAVFQDVSDADALQLERINRLVAGLPREKRGGMRHVDLLVLRPSRDLGELARDFEPRLPPLIRYLTRGWGTREARSPDVLSLVLFQPDYVQRLIELGEADAKGQADRVEAFLSAPGGSAALASSTA
jgi:NTE family protein